MSRRFVLPLRRPLFLGLLALLLTPVLGSAQQPFPTILDWTTDPQSGTVHFQLRWTNTGTQPSVPVSGTMSSQPFGVFQQNYAPIGNFNVPSLAVDSFFDIFYEVALADLPPGPREVLPGGGPGAPGVHAVADSGSCPPDDHWDGNVDVAWQGAGTTGQVNVHYGSLQVCPGAGASYIHVREILCNSAVGATWTVTGLCPGFNVSVVNEDYTPAPANVPFLWSGWLCVTADNTVPVGATCCPQVVFNCDGDDAAITLCVSACDWGVPPDPVLVIPDWTTDPATGTVHFALHWANPGTQTSKPAQGTMSSQAFGVFLPDFGPIGNFNVPALAPDSFFDIFFDVSLASLPPGPSKILPGGSAPAPGVTPLADASCPPDDHWDGNVDVTWSTDGLPTEVHKHYGSLQVCPGGGASYIHLAELICNSPVGISWSIQDLCPGFTATMVNQDYTPAPAFLPANWLGWICVTADPSVAVGDSCCPKVVFDCGGDPAEITLCARACDWGTAPNPVLTVPDWTTNLGTGTVHFTLHWTNPNRQQTSKPAQGNMSSQAFGVFQPDFGSLGNFNVPPLAPDSFFDVFIDIPLINLPPLPQKTTPGGGGGTAPGVNGLADAPCPPDDHWDGTVDVVWFVDGQPSQVNVHYGSIQLCPGGGASYIHIPALQCPAQQPITWTVAGLCPGFNATLVNENFTPAPVGLPPFWTGWICLTAAANLPSGTVCCPTVTFDCDGEPATITLCATTCDWNPGAPDPVVGVPDWTTDPLTGLVHFQLHVHNPDLSQVSHPAFGTMSSQPFGVFQANAGTIGNFEIPPLAPDSFFDIFFDVALTDLPPGPSKMLPGGNPAPGVNALADSASCPPDDHWDGNVDVFWQGAGAPAMVNVHYGSLRVCPGAGNSYIHIPALQCNSPVGVSWTITNVCSGFGVSLVNQDFTPAPPFLPPAWMGWICVTAGAGVPLGTVCCPKVIFDCDGVPGEVTLCAEACDWSNAPDPVVGVPDWTTDPLTGIVHFQLHWSNPNPQQNSKPAQGTMSSQMFGVFQPDFGPIGNFNVPALAPDSFFDIFFDVALTNLPPAPTKTLPGNAPSPGVTPLADASCPPDDHWDGNVDITWSTDGLPTQINKHYGSLRVCPGGGASYIHLAELFCNSPVGISWSIQDLCPGFTATLVNQDSTTAAPPFLPPNWSGWICVTADPSVAVGDSCCPKVVFDCDGVPAEITLCARACDWGNSPDPVVGIPDWTTDPITGHVQFTLHWTNPDPNLSSKPAQGTLSSQMFGVFQPNHGAIGNFNVPALAPDSFFDIFFDVSPANLPSPPMKLLPGGGPPAPGVNDLADSASCPPDDHWDGNVDVVWFSDGLPAQVNAHYGNLRVCPGAGASYIHIPALQCNSPVGISWSITDLCPGFFATLVNEDFTPAPAGLFLGWTGWICVTAAPGVAIGTVCCPKVVFDCDGVPAEIVLCTDACDWANAPDPTVSIPDWTTNTATGTVQFTLHWSNPSPQQSSNPVAGTLSSQMFGVFQPNHGVIGNFNVPALAPDSFFDIFYEVLLTDLPPMPQKVLPGGGPGAPGVHALADSSTCLPQDHWDGNVDVVWTGGGALSQVNVHYGEIRTCPGGGSSYIHIPALACPNPVTWTVADLCSGFTVTLVNEDFTPAPAALPPGWTGFICINAAAAVVDGFTCCPRVIFDCDGVPAEVRLCTTTCSWAIGGVPTDRPAVLAMQARPNPMFGSTTVSFRSQNAGEARIDVFSTTGRLVRTLFSGQVPQGEGAVVWDGRDDHGASLSAGVYMIRMSLGGESVTRKVSLLVR